MEASRGRVEGYSLLTRESANIYTLRIFSTIIFAVLYSSLALILIKKFNFDLQEAARLTSTFFVTHFISSIVGGWLGQRYFLYKQMFVVGKVFFLAGLTLLYFANTQLNLVYIGLSLILMDSMVSTVSINMKLKEYISKNELEEFTQPIYTLNHTAINLGFIAGFVISGLFYAGHHFDGLLRLSIFVVGVSVFLSYALLPPDIEPQDANAQCKYKGYLVTLLGMFLSAAPVYVMMRFVSVKFELVLVAICILGYVLLFPLITRSLTIKEKMNVVKVSVFMVFAALFWAVYMLEPTFFPQFIDLEVDTNILGITFPPQIMQLVTPISVTLFTFLIARWLKQQKESGVVIQSSNQFVFGLLVLFAAMLLLSIGTKASGSSMIGKEWIAIFFVLIALAESCIAPISPKLVSEVIPSKIQGIFQGASQAIVGVSGTMSGYIVSYHLLLKENGTHLTHSDYTNVFMNISIIVLVSTVLLFLMRKKLYVEIVN